MSIRPTVIVLLVLMAISLSAAGSNQCSRSEWCAWAEPLQATSSGQGSWSIPVKSVLSSILKFLETLRS